MPVVIALAAVLRWNYLRGKANRSTFCSFWRPRLSPAEFLTLLAVGLLWFVPHFLNPTLERPLVIPEALRRMPAKILFGTARGIEQWLVAEYPNQPGLRPTLLELVNARKAHGKRRR